jgi:hypothetical protein
LCDDWLRRLQRSAVSRSSARETAKRFIISEVFHAIHHFVTHQHAVQEFQRLDKLPDRVFCGVAPGNPRMLEPAGSEHEKIGVMRHEHSFIGCGKLQLVWVINSAPPRVLGG